MCADSDMSDQNSRQCSKVFIGGLSWETTGEKLRAYFENYGVVREAFVSYNRNNGRPRGFGFVVFESPDVADKVVACKHTIDRREVEAKKAVPKDEQQGDQQQQQPSQMQGGNQSGHASSSDGTGKSRKIFVGGLAPSIDDAALRQYFEGFGQVDDAVVMYDHGNRRPRGFGFVTFAAEESIEMVFAKGSMQTIQDKPIEIKSAVPRDQMPPSARGPPMSGYIDPRAPPPPRGGQHNNSGNNNAFSNFPNGPGVPSQLGNLANRGFGGGQRNYAPTVQPPGRPMPGPHYSDSMQGMPAGFPQQPGGRLQQQQMGGSGMSCKLQGMPGAYELYSGNAGMFNPSQAALAYKLASLQQQAQAHLSGLHSGGPGANSAAGKLNASAFGANGLNLEALRLAGSFSGGYPGGQGGDGSVRFSEHPEATDADYAEAAAAAAGLGVGSDFNSFHDANHQYNAPAPSWAS